MQKSQELKDLLSVSNGFQVLGRTATVFSVDDIGFRYKGIPEEYIVFGEITGDDEKLCFHEKTGKLVTIKDGVVYKYCLMTTQTTPTYPTPNGESYTWTDNPSGVSESYPYEYVVAYSTSVVVINAKKIKTAQRSFPFEGEGSWK